MSRGETLSWKRLTSWSDYYHLKIINDKRIKILRFEGCIQSNDCLYTGRVDFQTIIYWLNDWPIVQKSYLTLTFQTFHFLLKLFSALHCFKGEILINKNIATFQFIYVLVRQRLTNNSTWCMVACLSFCVMCSLYVNIFEDQIFWNSSSHCPQISPFFQ